MIKKLLEKKRLKEYMGLKEVIEVFNKLGQNGRYPKSAYDKAFRDLEISLRAKTRRDKIKKMFNEN